ncbi:MAG: 16S rRNA (guanine(966)-N(2))-methyltransferase RsmD [Rhizobiaceae bacterium]
MRVIGGKFRGNRIFAPKGQDTRPTTDRVRENLFNILENRISLNGIRVLDLFSGSGALGIESMSRGAGFCLFVEQAGAAQAAVRQNIEQLQLTALTGILRRDATRLGDIGTMQPFDLVFADPPYNLGLGEQAAKSLIQGGWLRGNAIFILEERKSAMLGKLTGFSAIDMRTYGDTSIGLFEYRGL